MGYFNIQYLYKDLKTVSYLGGYQIRTTKSFQGASEFRVYLQTFSKDKQKRCRFIINSSCCHDIYSFDETMRKADNLVRDFPYREVIATVIESKAKD